MSTGRKKTEVEGGLFGSAAGGRSILGSIELRPLAMWARLPS